jgi:MarR family transcriptional regulator, lower aerobic nicotinate degradation pathway regulator
MSEVNDRTATADSDSTPSRRHPGTTIAGAPIGSLLLQVLRAHGALGTELLRRVGVMAPHEIILLYIDEHGPQPQTGLVHYLGRDRSTVTNTLQAMERADLVQRVPSSTDRRAVIVDLTVAGRRAAPMARAAWAELEEATVQGLSGRQRDEFAKALGIVRDQLSRAMAVRDR